MVKEDTIKFITELKMTYLNFYKDISKEEYAMLVELWHEDFIDIPYKAVRLAFSQYKNSPNGKFPPVAGQIKDIIARMNPTQNVTPNEAYALVYKAICNSGYYENAKEEYNKLPSNIQRVISVERLMQLAKSEDEASLVTFEASFKREYVKALEEKKSFDALPLKQQENVLKLQNMTSNLFDSLVLGHKEKLLEVGCGTNEQN